MNPLDLKRQHQVAGIAFCVVGAIAGIFFAWLDSPFRQLSSHSVSGQWASKRREDGCLSDCISILNRPHGATWRSGYATVCKTVYTSSILVVASSLVIDFIAVL
jgi:hypothetical protein